MSNSFANPQHVAQQTPLPMGFQKYWSRLPFPSPDLFHPEIESTSPASPALAGGFFTAEPLGKSLKSSYCCSVTQLCLTLWDPMDCSMPGFPDLHHLTKFAQTHVHWVGDAIQPSISSSVVPFSCFLSFPASGFFQWSQFFTSAGQSIGTSASAAVLPMNIQGWYPLELTGWIFLLSQGTLYGLLSP